MDSYDSRYLSVLAPLIVAQLPPNEAGSVIRDKLNKFNISSQIWNNCILRNRLLNNKYLISIVDDDSLLKRLSEPKTEHSIISPFNVNSELFPNGILSVEWFDKYLSQKPFAYIYVCDMPSDPMDDEALASKLVDLKNGYTNLGIKFICIITSNTEDPNGDEDRINRLRQLTSLARVSGLLYVNCIPDTIERDCELLITNLLSNIKTNALEFYTHIESKIKQRNKKYYSIPSSANIDTTIELTPKFLETRNLIKQGILAQYSHPHNLETCLKFLESGYGQLIELIRDNFFQFSKDRISEHDLKLYIQFRTLCDIVAFHIVRGYLSLEEPIIAIKKHQTHILNVIDAINGRIDLHQWVSIQYEWLGELLLLVPKSIVLNNHVNNKKSSTIGFIGGVKFVDENFEIFTNPGSIVLRAVENLSKFKGETNQLDYLNITPLKDINNKKIQLLKKTLDLIDGNKEYVNFLLAEEYFKQGEVDKAIEYYEKSYSKSDFINSTIVQKLIHCYQQLNKYDDTLMTMLKLCNYQSQTVKGESFDLSKVQTTLESTSGSFLKTDILFLDENSVSGISDEPTVYDKLVGQIRFKSNINSDVLKPYLGEINVDLVINKLIVYFSKGIETITVEHDSSISTNKLIKLDSTTAKANLEVLSKNESKFEILQFNNVIEKSGIYKLEKIEIHSCLVFNNTVTINHIETINNSVVKPYSKWYKHMDNQLVELPVKLKSSFTNSIKVIPLNPNTLIELQTPIKSIVVGEKVKLKFEIKFKNERKLNYNKVSLSPRVKIIQSEGKQMQTEDKLVDSASKIGDENSIEDLIDSKVNWNGLKDDEALILTNMNSDQSINAELNLSIYPNSLQNEQVFKTFERQYKVTIDLNTLVVEDEDEDNIVLYNSGNYEFIVLKEPFECKFTISPRFRDSNDMPSPFILHDENHLSMPIVTRVWQQNLTVDKSEEGIQIKSIEHSIKPKTPEIIVDILENQLFTTRSKNGISQRNITMVLSATIDWGRVDSEIINSYETQEWEILLPLTDPRVLLSIEPTEEPNTIKLKYIIENSTPRIFTFQTKLVDENERFIWNLDNEKNLSPLSISKFPVLPFNQFMLEYYGTFNSVDSLVQLPQLKVLDLQYKVLLPTLPVSNNVIISNGKLFYRTVNDDPEQ